MSLWKVLDWQTQELMEDLYRRILMGEPCMDALRAAQLAMKEGRRRGAGTFEVAAAGSVLY